METLLELETARQVCIRKLNTFTLSRTTQTLEEWEKSGLQAKFEEQTKLQNQWHERLQIINGKLYNLVEQKYNPTQ